jgi:hypothetical protein
VEGVLLHAAGDAVGAEARFRLLLGGGEAEHFASVDAGLRGPKARHNLALALRDQGKLAEARAHWQRCLADDPHFTPARQALAEGGLA